MARWPRLVVPGYPLHITHRGNNRVATFHSPRDFERFREILALECTRTRTEVHAYAFMTNHVHLLVTPRDLASLASMMQTVGRKYVPEFNRRYHRSGTLWEGRYKSSVVDSASYALACMRYIDLNPVRGGLVASAELYAWSSYGRLAFGAPDALVIPHAEYLALAASPALREREYRELCERPLPAPFATEIRSAARSGGAVGCQGFRDRIAAEVGRPVVRGPVGGDRRTTSFANARITQQRPAAGSNGASDTPAAL